MRLLSLLLLGILLIHSRQAFAQVEHFPETEVLHVRGVDYVVSFKPQAEHVESFLSLTPEEQTLFLKERQEAMLAKAHMFTQTSLWKRLIDRFDPQPAGEWWEDHQLLKHTESRDKDGLQVTKPIVESFLNAYNEVLWRNAALYVKEDVISSKIVIGGFSVGLGVGKASFLKMLGYAWMWYRDPSTKKLRYKLYWHVENGDRSTHQNLLLDFSASIRIARMKSVKPELPTTMWGKAFPGPFFIFDGHGAMGQGLGYGIQPLIHLTAAGLFLSAGQGMNAGDMSLWPALQAFGAIAIEAIGKVQMASTVYHNTFLREGGKSEETVRNRVTNWLTRLKQIAQREPSAGSCGGALNGF
ncbi:MAG: hypothetical protein AB7F59_08575 [Bdellovibrionales bacterium]